MKDRDEENDEFLVLACDGVWDVMTNEDLCDFIRSRLVITDDLEAITNQVVDTCLYKVSVTELTGFTFCAMFHLNMCQSTDYY